MADRVAPLLQLGRHLGDTAGRLMIEADRLRAAAIDPNGQPRRGPGWRLLNGFSTSIEQIAAGVRGLARPLSRSEQALHLPGFTRQDLAEMTPTSPVEDELLEAKRLARAFADGIIYGRDLPHRGTFERRFGRVWFRLEVTPADGGLHVSCTPMTVTLPQPAGRDELDRWVRAQLAELWPAVQWVRIDASVYWRGSTVAGPLTIVWDVLADEREPGILLVVVVQVAGSGHFELRGDGPTVAAARDMLVAHAHRLTIALGGSRADTESDRSGGGHVAINRARRPGDHLQGASPPSRPAPLDDAAAGTAGHGHLAELCEARARARDGWMPRVSAAAVGWALTTLADLQQQRDELAEQLRLAEAHLELVATTVSALCRPKAPGPEASIASRQEAGST